MKKESSYKDVRDIIHFNKRTVSNVPPQHVLERYTFSNFLIDPKRRDFRLIFRITALVFRFIRKLKESRLKESEIIILPQPEKNKMKIILNEEEIQGA